MPQLNSAFCEVDIKALKQVDELFDELVAQSQVITHATQKPEKSRSTEAHRQVSTIFWTKHTEQQQSRIYLWVSFSQRG